MKPRKLWALVAAIGVAAIGVAAIGVAACSDASQDEPLAPADPDLQSSRAAVRVTNSNDAGPGSFRAAVEAANAGGLDGVTLTGNTGGAIVNNAGVTVTQIP